MSMLTSYTLPSLAPAQAPVKSPPSRALQQREHQASSPLVVARALPWAPRKESRSRARLFACHAGKYDIPTDALMRPPTHPVDRDDWKIMENKDHILLMLNVGESTTMKELNVRVDPGLLAITSTGGSLGRSLDTALLMPPGYDSKKVTAVIICDGWLQLTVVKPKPTNLPVKDAREPPP